MEAFWKYVPGSCLVLILLLVMAPAAHADLEKSIEKLPARSFCINADLETAWEETAHVLSRMEIPPTLADHEHYVVTTAFVFADYGKLFKISSNPRPFLKGRFTMKITFTPVTDSYTKIHIVLQVRQNKAIGSDERLLKSRGSFEKFIAFQINQLAIGRKFPKLYEIRLGMDLIPDLKTEHYSVAEVETESPAGEAGFRPGDEIISIGGREITIRGELFQALLPEEPAKELEFVIRRHGKDYAVPVWIARVNDQEKKMGFTVKRDSKTREFEIDSVMPDSPADRSGMKPGYILTQAAGRPLERWSDYYRALAGAGGELQVTLRKAPSPDEMQASIPIPAEIKAAV